MRDGTISTAVHDWVQPLSSFYNRKWGADRLQQRSAVLDFIANTEGMDFHIEWEVLVCALDTVSKSGSRDRVGVSVLIIRAFIFGNPTAALALFRKLFTSRSFMQSFVIEGTVYGKESKSSPADRTRVILPLPALLAVADAAIAVKMHDLVTKHCPAPAGVMFGGRKGTQVLDVAHAVHLHLQKGGDNLGVAGLAQGDISTYYDSLNCLHIGRWMLERGLDVFWVCAFIRLCCSLSYGLPLVTHVSLLPYLAVWDRSLVPAAR